MCVKKLVKRSHIIISKESRFISPRKIGIDSCVLVELVNNLSLFSDVAMKIFNRRDIFITHKICFWETIEVLVKKHGWGKSEAIKSLKNLLTKLNIKIDNNSTINPNKLLLMKNKCEKLGAEFHELIQQSCITSRKLALTRWLTITS